MLNDGELTISVGRVIAVVAYGVAVVLLALMWFTGDRRWGITGLAGSTLGSVAMMRTYFVRFSQTFRNGFELGRDSVTPLRR